MATRHPCPCCGHLTLSEGPGYYELCPVCFWEDDGVQLRIPTASGANGICLIEAQAIYASLGTMAVIQLPRVRQPRSDEPREVGWHRLGVEHLEWFETRPLGRWPRDQTQLYWWRPTFWRRPVSKPPR